jgi:ABC-2 type transport system permease protein
VPEVTVVLNIGRVVFSAPVSKLASWDKGGFRILDEGSGQRLAVCRVLASSRRERRGQRLFRLDVTADGRYVADGDGPKEVNGYFPVRTPTGDTPNPLWQFDGNVDLLASTPKE